MAAVTNLSYPAVPTGYSGAESLEAAAPRAWVAQIALALNNVIKGKINCFLDVTLAENADTTTVTDARISAQSVLLLSPLTENAAMSFYYISAQSGGSCTITHANNPLTDRDFRLLILA